MAILEHLIFGMPAAILPMRNPGLYYVPDVIDYCAMLRITAVLRHDGLCFLMKCQTDPKPAPRIAWSQ